MERKKKRKKFKFIYKLLIVIGVFVGALFYFGNDIHETIFGSDLEIVPTRDSTLPTITMEVNENRINLLHGYMANLDEMIVRECITPLELDRTFTVKINEHGSNVKKLKYEVYTLEKQKLEEDSFTVLDNGGTEKSVKVELREKLESGMEYVLKLTLITNDSKRIYYYTRLKLYDDGHLKEKLEFIEFFHSTLLDGKGNRAYDLDRYLEPKSSADNTTFAHVNIHSDLDLISYGKLEPRVVSEETPTITEFYANMASIQRRFVVCVGTELGEEFYKVTENYRINYSQSRTFLYNYERDMQELFDINNFSLQKREFKLGITDTDGACTLASPDNKFMAFVYDGELIVYDIDKNKAAKAFTFRKSALDYEDEYYDKHGIKLLRVNNNGTVDFMVYGYMNSGEYAGRVGLVLYRYFVEHDAKEERLYLPVNSSYEVLKSDMTDFAYLTEYDSFYFSIFHGIYCYDLITGEMTCIASDVPTEDLVYVEDGGYIAWQNASSPLKSDRITILHLESGDEYTITPPEGYIRIYGKINSNIVYGFAKGTDIERKSDGSVFLPSYKLNIADGEGNVLKYYDGRKYNIEGIEIGDNILILKRVEKDMTDGIVTYTEAEDDTILNQLEVKTYSTEITKRVTDRLMTEYYVSIPGNEEIKKIPVVSVAGNIVINHETTERVAEPEERDSCYYAYSFGKIVAADEDAAKVIAEADNCVGTVINREGKIVWERGIKSTKSDISGVQFVSNGAGYTSLQAVLRMLTIFRNQEADSRLFDTAKESAYDWLNHNMRPSVVNMTGVTLDEALYYTYKKRPVLAMRKSGEAVLIIGYDPYNITIYQPALGSTTKWGLKDAEADFEKAGNIFISYID